jgi:hypothetical protein
LHTYIIKYTKKGQMEAATNEGVTAAKKWMKEQGGYTIDSVEEIIENENM